MLQTHGLRQHGTGSLQRELVRVQPRKHAGFGRAGLSAAAGTLTREIVARYGIGGARERIRAGRIGRIGQNEDGRRSGPLEPLDDGLDIRGRSANYDQTLIV
jgi:hypothetical protein